MPPRDAWLPRLEQRQAVIVTTGCVCLVLERMIAQGRLPWIPVPSLGGWLPVNVLIAYLVLPMAVLAIVGENPLAYVSARSSRAMLAVMGCGAVAVAASAVWLGSLPSLRAYYGTGAAPAATFAGQALINLFCVEFFFRGFLLLPFVDRLGWHAAFMPLMPYALLHAGKPALEAFGSIAFGLGLSWLAIRARTIVYGLGLHWLLASALAMTLAMHA